MKCLAKDVAKTTYVGWLLKIFLNHIVDSTQKPKK